MNLRLYQQQLCSHSNIQARLSNSRTSFSVSTLVRGIYRNKAYIAHPEDWTFSGAPNAETTHTVPSTGIGPLLAGLEIVYTSKS